MLSGISAYGGHLMARRPAARNAAGKPRTKRKKRKKRSRLARLWPTATTRRRWLRRFRRTPGPIRVVTVLAVVAVVGLATNWIYQVIRKPSELFFPVSGTLFKTPPETWRSYAPIFRK
ncbi:MAG: hypothetical protein ACRETD_03605, partial [Steroidobacteraceae bacterium]